MWGNFIAKWDRYYKLGETLIESRVVSRYYKVGQELLQSGSNNLLHSRAVATGKGVDTTKWENFITNWGRYCNKRQSLQSRDLHRTKVTSRSRLEKSIVLLYSSSLPT